MPSSEKEGYKGFILPNDNAKEAAIVNDLEVYGVDEIEEVIEYFDQETPLDQTIVDTRKEFYEALIFQSLILPM